MKNFIIGLIGFGVVGKAAYNTLSTKYKVVKYKFTYASKQNIPKKTITSIANLRKEVR